MFGLQEKDPEPRLDRKTVDEIRAYADQQDHDSGGRLLLARPEIALLACIVLLLCDTWYDKHS